MSIIVTGSIAWDYLMRFPGHFKDHILAGDKISVSFLVDDKERHRGGTAPNIAYNLALLGERPIIVGAAGLDFADYRDWLESVGVDTSYISVHPDEFTATFSVITDLDHNQIASFHTGAMARAREIDLRDIGAANIDWVIISPDDPVAMVNHTEACREMGVNFIYDPSQQLARISREEFMTSVQGATILTVNDYELELARQLSGLDEAGLLELVQAIVVTRGPDGASVITKEGEITVPSARPAAVLEPTGVGDAFRAGLLVGLKAGYDWETILKLGNSAAVYVIEQMGTQNHAYTREQFLARVRENYGDLPILEECCKRG
jgi:adenosine kinase